MANTPIVNSESGDIVVRTLQYRLPGILKGHVNIVQPTTFFGLQQMRSTISDHRAFDESTLDTEAVGAVTGCSGSTVTPKCLSNLYSFASATAYTNGLMGIAGFLEQWPFTSDLSTFLMSYATEENSGQSFTCTLVNGGTCPQSGTPGVEANLDVQYARAITEKIPTSSTAWGVVHL
jgi:tripeptidyl-peptidase-1